MNYLIPEDIKNQILELKKTMERIKLDGLNFEYNQNPYGDIERHIRGSIRKMRISHVKLN